MNLSCILFARSFIAFSHSIHSFIVGQYKWIVSPVGELFNLANGLRWLIEDSIVAEATYRFSQRVRQSFSAATGLWSSCGKRKNWSGNDAKWRKVQYEFELRKKTSGNWSDLKEKYRNKLSTEKTWHNWWCSAANFAFFLLRLRLFGCFQLWTFWGFLLRRQPENHFRFNGQMSEKSKASFNFNENGCCSTNCEVIRDLLCGCTHFRVDFFQHFTQTTELRSEQNQRESKHLLKAFNASMQFAGEYFQC